MAPGAVACLQAKQRFGGKQANLAGNSWPIWREEMCMYDVLVVVVDYGSRMIVLILRM